MSFNYNHIQAEHSKMTENSLMAKVSKYFGLSKKNIQMSINEGRLTCVEPLLYLPALDEFLGKRFFYCCRDSGATMKLAALFNNKKFVRTTIYEAWNTGIGIIPDSKDAKHLVMVFNMFKQVYVMSADKPNDLIGGLVLPEGLTMEPLGLFLRRLYDNSYEEETEEYCDD